MILLKPYMTEKTLAQGAFDRFAFVVAPNATKYQIKDAVEKNFKVSVIKVTTHTKKPVSSRSFRTGHMAATKQRKIAIVQLKSKQTIDLFKTK